MSRKKEKKGYIGNLRCLVTSDRKTKKMEILCDIGGEVLKVDEIHLKGKYMSYKRTGNFNDFVIVGANKSICTLEESKDGDKILYCSEE